LVTFQKGMYIRSCTVKLHVISLTCDWIISHLETAEIKLLRWIALSYPLPPTQFTNPPTSLPPCRNIYLQIVGLIASHVAVSRYISASFSNLGPQLLRWSQSWSPPPSLSVVDAREEREPAVLPAPSYAYSRTLSYGGAVGSVSAQCSRELMNRPMSMSSRLLTTPNE